MFSALFSVAVVLVVAWGFVTQRHHDVSPPDQWEREEKEQSERDAKRPSYFDFDDRVSR